MRAELPALTGIRFLAAFSVALAHGLIQLVRFNDTPPVIEAIQSLSGLGMSMFFVLSGFVIHYTYGSSVTKRYGVYNFFVARFARLYPLFIAAFAIELFYHLQTNIPPFGYDLRALPYYVTLTQTWWFAVLHEQSLIYQFGNIAQISWSISTEAWFYLAYLPVVFVLRKTHKPGQTLAIGLAVCVAAVFAVLSITSHFQAINDFGLLHFGEVAELGQDSLFRWLLNLSPYVRVNEFLLGCITAHLFLQFSNRPVGATEAHFGLLLALLAIFVMGLIHVLL